MTRWRLFIALFVALACYSGPAVAQSTATTGLDRLKSLAGAWEGKSDDGQPVHSSFQVTSGGVTVLQMIQPSGWPEKPTLYHLDGDSLMLTHYCSANNQPRMRAVVPAGAIKRLVFSFLDSTNLPDPSRGYMHRVLFTFEDSDHFTQEWIWREKGRDTPAVFHFTRKR